MKGKTNVEESETGELRKRPSWDCRRTDWRRLEKERDALVQWACARARDLSEVVVLGGVVDGSSAIQLGWLQLTRALVQLPHLQLVQTISLPLIVIRLHTHTQTDLTDSTTRHLHTYMHAYSLPDILRSAQSINTFKRLLKSFLFSVSYPGLSFSATASYTSSLY